MNNAFKIFQYAYLAFALYFLYDVITKYMNTGVITYSSLLLCIAATFMFFFRQKFNKKFKIKTNSCK